MEIYLVPHPEGGADIPICVPLGYTTIEEGTIQSGDMFLLGGRHNAWTIGRGVFHDILPNMVGKPISPFALIIRPIESSEAN